MSLFADMTYEGAYSGIGPFLNELGVSAALVGFISGFGEMVAASLRYFSGKFADRTRAAFGRAAAAFPPSLPPFFAGALFISFPTPEPPAFLPPP